jgi:hypothetical protein
MRASWSRSSNSSDTETKRRGDKEKQMGAAIRSHKELQVYQRAFRAAMEIFELTRSFPRDEMFSLTNQIRRSSRSVNMNLAEAWRKRRYEAAWVAKLSDAESEAAETQT